jgi:fermentation-respiration switch protein FrsA (DUF1100 family)
MIELIRAMHLVLMAVYVSAPLAALWLDIRYLRRRGRKAPSPAYVGTACAGIALGTCISVAFAAVVGARGSVGQAALASYFAASMLFLLKGFDGLLRNGLLLAIRKRRWLLMPAAMARLVLLFGIGLPYIMAAGLTYRPKVIPRDDPASRFGVGFDAVSFKSTDGIPLAGWWIPAIDSNGEKRFSESTVVICHGAGIGKESALPLLAGFVPQGFNVLMFDFRALGGSGGQIVSFGDNERRDVLGAVTWLQQTHASQSVKIYGLGVETGGAALIAAAGDPGAAGQSIRAVAVYGCFDNLPALARSLANERFAAPFNWLFSRVGLAMADFQTGADLTDFSPAREIQNVWPRPVYIVNGSTDPEFPMEMGRELYEEAPEPKSSRWVNGATTADLIKDSGTADAVRKFFSGATPLPVI